MNTLVFEAGMGAAGDMILGTCLALGGDNARLDPIADALDLEVSIEEVTRNGVTGIDVDVSETDTIERTPEAVHDVIDDLPLAQSVTDRSHRTVDRLTRAEAAVHGEEEAAVHFHAVGADDAIFDICGTLTLLEDIGVEQVVVGPITTGTGRVETDHGVYPVPVPAVSELAADSSLVLESGPVDAELLTPTGAAVLAEVAESRVSLPAMRLDRIGYGFGDRQFPDRPNALRGSIGTVVDSLRQEPITVLETVVDDVTPETLGRLHDRLHAHGARDVTVLPTTMKKARPGHLIQVVVPPEAAERVARRLAAETGTLGIREHSVTHRWQADREQETVTIEVDGHHHEIDVKVARDTAGSVIDVSAEDDDAAAIAATTDQPVRHIRKLAERQWHEAHPTD